jgi:hypothetical protein
MVDHAAGEKLAAALSQGSPVALVFGTKQVSQGRPTCTPARVHAAGRQLGSMASLLHLAPHRLQHASAALGERYHAVSCSLAHASRAGRRGWRSAPCRPPPPLTHSFILAPLPLCFRAPVRWCRWRAATLPSMPAARPGRWAGCRCPRSCTWPGRRSTWCSTGTWRGQWRTPTGRARWCCRYSSSRQVSGA